MPVTTLRPLLAAGLLVEAACAANAGRRFAKSLHPMSVLARRFRVPLQNSTLERCFGRTARPYRCRQEYPETSMNQAPSRPEATQVGAKILESFQALCVAALLCASCADAATMIQEYSFLAATDGSAPTSRLVLAGPSPSNQQSYLWGTTTTNGGSGSGEVFNFRPFTGAEVSPAAFPDGVVPNSPLVQVPRPNGEILLYGTATGGPLGYGLIYKYSSLAPNSIIIVHNFTAANCEGASPAGSLAVVRVGQFKGALKIIGATQAGGCYGQFGTIYQVDLAGNYQTLHSFSGNNGGDGKTPNGVISAGGSLGNLIYGSVRYGGPSDGGYVYSFDVGTGQLSPLCTFTQSTYNINFTPNSDLALAFDPYGQDMMIYGTSTGDVFSGKGALYQCSPASGAMYALHYFFDSNYSDPIDLSYISAKVASAPVVARGKVYGTAVDYVTNRGVIYSYDQLSFLYQHAYVFAGGSDGSGAPGGLAYFAYGLYGTTPDGGNGAGSVFRFQDY